MQLALPYYGNTRQIEKLAQLNLKLAEYYSSAAKYAEALEVVFESLDIFQELDNQRGMALAYASICDLLYSQIDRANRVRAIYFYPNEVGRSTAEIIRTLKALQKTDDNVDLKTPADWQEGEPAMIGHPNSVMLENMGQPGSIYFQYAWFMVYWKNEE